MSCQGRQVVVAGGAGAGEGGEAVAGVESTKWRPRPLRAGPEDFQGAILRVRSVPSHCGMAAGSYQNGSLSADLEWASLGRVVL